MTEHSVRDVSRSYQTQSLDPNTGGQYLINDPTAGIKVLSAIKQAITAADRVDAAIAFVTMSGVAALRLAIEEMLERGGEFNLVTSDYLHFTQPRALRVLHSVPGLNLRLLRGVNYHGKLYHFQTNGNSQIIVGSSNLTQNALSKNDEINYQFFGDNASSRATQQQISRVWKAATPVTEALLTEYETAYNALRSRDSDKLTQLTSFSPNSLQKPALQALQRSRAAGKTRGLIVSATGTGKTVLSAFDVRLMKANRALFVVHRGTIARKALQTFKQVLTGKFSFGLVTGGEADWDSDFLFGTVQTLARPDNLARLAPDRFDYIVVDETHRAAAESYQRLINHFKPRFLLGMTATPERSDAQDIFGLFHNNIVCDIRLNDALEAEILCPFHYYGIADVFLEQDPSLPLELFQLTRADRFKHLLESSKRFATDRDPVKCLVFVSRVEEAEAFASYLNARGEPAAALTGKSSDTDKQNAIDDIESGRLNYIVTVDLFNEGVDIPSINQLLMARPTQSAIVFVQQFGRGLRRHNNKDYLTVIDIVGNYQNNFLIPIALYGDRSQNKDTLRRLVRAEETQIPGVSTINFDRVAKELIFKAIQTAKNVGVRELKVEYQAVKSRLGQSPSLKDMAAHGDLDPLMFCRHTKFKSLHEFALQYDDDYAESNLVGDFKELGGLISEALDGTGPFEPAAAIVILKTGQCDLYAFKAACDELFGIQADQKNLDAAIRVLNLEYSTPSQLNPIDFQQWVSQATSFQLEKIQDAVEFSIDRFRARLTLGRYNNGFVVGTKYTYKETFRILGWSKNPNPQNIGGYFLNRSTNDCAIFVNYHKSGGIAETTQYNDYFINTARFHWTTKSRRRMTSPEVVALLDQANTKLRVPLFIRKEAESEGSARYYLGELSTCVGTQQSTIVGGEAAVNMEFDLDKPVPNALYKHLLDQ